MPFQYGRCPQENVKSFTNEGCSFEHMFRAHEYIGSYAPLDNSPIHVFKKLYIIGVGRMRLNSNKTVLSKKSIKRWILHPASDRSEGWIWARDVQGWLHVRLQLEWSLEHSSRDFFGLNLIHSCTWYLGLGIGPWSIIGGICKYEVNPPQIRREYYSYHTV